MCFCLFYLRQIFIFALVGVCRQEHYKIFIFLLVCFYENTS